jgi:hypothetical protein
MKLSTIFGRHCGSLHSCFRFYCFSYLAQCSDDISRLLDVPARVEPVFSYPRMSVRDVVSGEVFQSCSGKLVDLILLALLELISTNTCVKAVLQRRCIDDLDSVNLIELMDMA